MGEQSETATVGARRWVRWALIIGVALLWALVFISTGALWWSAPDRYGARLTPPQPLFNPAPTFDGVDPEQQYVPDQLAEMLRAHEQDPEPGHRHAP